MAATDVKLRAGTEAACNKYRELLEKRFWH